jgi:DNA-binding CsgD family transcriptional regulator
MNPSQKFGVGYMSIHNALRGRDEQLSALDDLLIAIGAGESRALVLRGEAGMGKTALLDYLAEQAVGYRVARTTGVQCEMELAFAGLHRLCAPMLDRLERLPGPQRDALGTAFGLSAGPAPDRFLVGLAVLNMLAEVPEEQPLVCLIDDAQWLDRASVQALAFVARRLLAESVAIVFATRTQGEERDLADLPELVVEGLRDPEARALLGTVIPGRLDEQVRDRIVAETRGNPLALLELPRGLTAAELAGGFGLPSTLPLPARIEESFRRQAAPLGAASQLLLLVAAAEPVGEPALVWRAARHLGIRSEAAAPAAETGLLEFGARVRFRHPLVRSAVYRSASPEDRRRVHAALADATDPDLDPDRRAWHRAEAASGPDEAVAAELERSAGRAQARGGLAAAAAFLERAAALTLEPTRRAERALAAAAANAQAGAHDGALRLLATAEAGPLDELQRGRVELLRGQITFALNYGSDAPPLLLQAAKQLAPLNVALARETYLEAISAGLVAAHLAGGGGLLEIAQAARAAPPPSQPPHGPDQLLDAFALLITEGYPAAAAMLKRAVQAFRGQDITTAEELRWLWLAGVAAESLWDDESWDLLSTRDVQLARDTGALGVLPIALSTRAGVHLFAGELGVAAALAEEVAVVTEVTGSRIAPYGALGFAAFSGRDAEGAKLIESGTRDAVDRGQGSGLTFIHWATAVLCNGLGRYPDALAAARRARADTPEQVFSIWAAVELIEAATRSGVPEHAADVLQRLSECTQASGTEWALGIEARSRALLSSGQAADSRYREAIDRLGRTRVRVELARAHLLYGEWLRREHRRIDAREQLRTAHEMLAEIGMEAFAERAARELRATGETARKRIVETSSHLTTQEAQIARLARDGLSNPEIGVRLFISPRTVEYHLHKVFTKLDISSRGQLNRALPNDPGTVQPG